MENLCGKILKCPSPEIHYASEAIIAWKSLCPNDNVPQEETQQKQWDVPLVQKTFDILAQTFFSDRDRARLLAVSQHESGQWLNAIPSKSIGTLLDNRTFRVALGLRLGAAICEPHRCSCGSDVDKYGIHGLSCQKSAGRFFRHSSLNDIVRRALNTINVPSVLEPVGLARDDGKRPDGMTLVPWERGRALVWDATCVDTLAPSHLSGTITKAGAAAEAAENAKRRKYEVLSDDYIFAPLGVETLGPWGPSTKSFLKKITPLLIDAAGDKRAGSFLAQRISLAIQRGNTASALGTLPYEPNSLYS